MSADRSPHDDVGAEISAAMPSPSLDLEVLGGRLEERAGQEGLLTATYTTLESPAGLLFAAASERGLLLLGYPTTRPDSRLEDLSERIGPRLISSPARFETLRRQLDEYFAGKRRDFELPLDWSLTSGFVRKVLVETAHIPYGETRSYGQIAALAGSPRAFRAAGSALGANPIPIVVPCHRVLRSDGGVGGYGGGLEMKRLLLGLEGVPQPR